MYQILAERLSMQPTPERLVLVFFTYAFLGYILECIMLSLQYKRLVLNRGFVVHLPFCIIYSFGAILGYALLRPIAHNYVALFLVGAVGATMFEFLVAQLQIRIFGDFWWDYTEKPLNYKGILCLESTIGWGVAALLVLHLLHGFVVWGVSHIPQGMRGPLAVALVLAYVADFIYSARLAAHKKQQDEKPLEMAETVYLDED